MGLFVRVATLLLLLTTSIVAAWDAQDHEIFRIRDELRKHEGTNVTFYSFMNLKAGASQDEINKAYRKLSRTLHPDKARANWIANYNKPKVHTLKPGEKPGVHVQKNKNPSQSETKKFNKEASARFERLSLVANILRGEARDRYDHFLANGFPAWRGTGYYYERYRPGLGTVLTGLFIFVGGGVHYAALYLGWKRQREFVERYIKHARRAAWGDDSGLGTIPGLGNDASANGKSNQQSPEDEDSMQWNRRQKRALEREKKKEKNSGVSQSASARNAASAAKARQDGISTPQDGEIISGPVGTKKRTVAENGKILIVDSAGNVFLEDETEEGKKQEFLLDPNEVPVPTIRSTFLVRFPVFIYNQSLGRVLNKQTPESIAAEAQGEGGEGVDEATAILHGALQPNANAETRKRRKKATW